MKLIVGLGNPGPQYTSTRHNAGFMVVDRLRDRHAAGQLPKARFKAVTCEVTIAGEKCLLLKPTTYMNLSGQSVGEAAAFFKLDPVQDLLVVVDDLYLPTGAVRLRPAGSAGGHNGLSDIQRSLGRDDYPRLRLGVGIQPAGGKPPMIDQADFVLSRFTSDEAPLLDHAVTRAVQGAELWAGKGLAHAMNVINAPDARGAGGPERPVVGSPN